MTSVPKPLKFLRNQYDTLKGVYEKISDKTTKVKPLPPLSDPFEASWLHCPVTFWRFLKEFCADILSVLGMTISEKRECLKYRYLSSRETVGSWGHEYVR